MASVPAGVEAAYQQARTQYGAVFMNDFDAALALAYAPRLNGTVKRQIKISKEILRTLTRHPQTYSSPRRRKQHVHAGSRRSGRHGNVQSLLDVDDEAKIELEGMYLPLHLKFPELHDGSPLRYAEQVYGRVFNVPNRTSLDFFEVRRLRRLLDGFGRVRP